MSSIFVHSALVHHISIHVFLFVNGMLCVFQVRKHHLISAPVADPYRGDIIRRLTKNGRILLPADEIEQCINFFYRLSLGDGAAKSAHRISEHYFGISKNRVVSFLNAHPVHSKLNPSFKHKAPLQPIITQQIMERHQIDLVSFENNSVERDGKHYSYVLSIIIRWQGHTFVNKTICRNKSVDVAISASYQVVRSHFKKPTIILCKKCRTVFVTSQYEREVL